MLKNGPYASDELSKLYSELSTERDKTFKEAARGNRFHSLRRDEKELVGCMSKELQEYARYLNTLKDATFLHKFISMVQHYTLKKLRELFLDMSALVGDAYESSLENLMFKLREIYQQHDRLNAYLSNQAFRTWAVGSAYNPKQKHKPLFRYHFPDCDYHRPLVIRNPCLWLENAVRMFYILIDVYTKFEDTRAYALSSSQHLWLGRKLHDTVVTVKSTDYSERLWLHCDKTFECNNHCNCIKYNAIWFPQFHMYLQFSCVQTLCTNDLFIAWNKTTNCCDDLRKKALFERCYACCQDNCTNVVPCVHVELYYRASVDWNLFCPFNLKLNYTQRDCESCKAVQHGSKYARVPGSQHQNTRTVCLSYNCVREDCLMITNDKSDVKPGTYLNTNYNGSEINVEHWRNPLNQLREFYSSAIERMDMHLLQTESGSKQIAAVISSIRENIAMYSDLISSFVNVNIAQSVNKICKLNDIICTIEQALESTSMKVFARSSKSGLTYVIDNASLPRSNKSTPIHDCAPQPTFGPDCDTNNDCTESECNHSVDSSKEDDCNDNCDIQTLHSLTEKGFF